MMCSARLPILLLLLAPLSLLAQRGGAPAAIPAGPPKNLKILPADVNIQRTMGNIRTALGVQCNFCHAAGDFASDDNPKKAVARNMMRITADLNAGFPDGKQHVTCYTCHLGDATPKREPPAATDGVGGRGGSQP